MRKDKIWRKTQSSWVRKTSWHGHWTYESENMAWESFLGVKRKEKGRLQVRVSVVDGRK